MQDGNEMPISSAVSELLRPSHYLPPVPLQYSKDIILVSVLSSFSLSSSSA